MCCQMNTSLLRDSLTETANYYCITAVLHIHTHDFLCVVG